MELKHLFAAAAIAAVPFAAQADLKPMQAQDLRAVDGQGVNLLTAIDTLVDLGALDAVELLDNLVDLGAIDEAYEAEGMFKSSVDELIDLDELDAFDPVDEAIDLAAIDERIELAALATIPDVLVGKRVDQLNARAERRDDAAAFLRGLGANPDLYTTVAGATAGALLESGADFAGRRATFVDTVFGD